VLPAFIHKPCVPLARSSINFLREGSPPTHFSASEIVTTNRLEMQIRAQCWQEHVQLNWAVNVSDSITVLLSHQWATLSKLLAMQLPFYAVTPQRNQNDRSHQIPNTCIIMFTINSLHQVHHTNTHLKGCVIYTVFHISGLKLHSAFWQNYVRLEDVKKM